jgi:hypothetical protein
MEKDFVCQGEFGYPNYKKDNRKPAPFDKITAPVSSDFL